MPFGRKKNLQELASDVIHDVAGALEATVQDAVEATREHARGAQGTAAVGLAALADKAAALASDTESRASSAADTAREARKSTRKERAKAVKAARTRSRQAAEQAREDARAAAESAAESARTAAADARRDAAELSRRQAKKLRKESKKLRRDGAAKVAAFADVTSTKTSDARNAAKAYADTAAIKAGLKEEPKSGGKLKKLVMFGLVAAIGGAIYKKLSTNPDTTAWQQSYTPKPPPAPAAPAAAAAPSPSAHDHVSDPETDMTDEGGTSGLPNGPETEAPGKPADVDPLTAPIDQLPPDAPRA